MSDCWPTSIPTVMVENKGIALEGLQIRVNVSSWAQVWQETTVPQSVPASPDEVIL